MNQRPFNRTGFEAAEVGLGAWQLGGEWGDVSDDQALSILHAAADHGVNFIDTADVYGAGRSESLIGRFLRDRSERFFVATKLGRFPEPGGPQNLTEASFREHTEASLKRLGVDALDLTQLHCIPTEEMRRGACFEWLRQLKQEGKIRHFGASVESMEEAMICLQHEDLTSLQIIFNIFRQKPIDELFSQAHSQGVALIIRLPLASGLLSGKFRPDTQFPENDHRHFNRDGQRFNVGETFAGLPFEQGVELAEGLRAYKPEGMTLAQMAIRWILDFEAVSVVIPGAKRVEQVTSNTACSTLPRLPEELHHQLRTYYEERVRQHIRGPY